MRAVTVLSFFTLLKGVFAVSEVVDLSYASYRGTALSNGVTQWLGMRFAAPPLGHLRFAAPEDPLRETSGIKPAHAHGPYCLGTASGPPTNVSSEDCLFMDIYAPSHAKPGSKLPVYLFIQGGGFNADSNANFNGSGLVIASHLDIVVVTFNYRVGPYGFLAGEEILKHGSVNNGLKDQRQAMHWVQKYISKFGGDPGHVTIGGDSAGAQSVDLHVTAYGGRNDNLFQATTAESQSFSSLRTVAESQFMYDGLVLRAGCASRVDTLACLRGLSAEALQAININTPFPGAQDPPLYMYGPTLDYDFITDYTYRAYAQGKFLHLPALAGDDTNEGTIFVPMDTANLSMSDIFIQSQFPTISLHQLRNFNELYPVKGTPSFPNAGRYWRQASNGYGEMRYTCPGVFISNVYANEKVAANWNYRWNVMDPTSEEEGKSEVYDLISS